MIVAGAVAYFALYVGYSLGFDSTDANTVAYFTLAAAAEELIFRKFLLTTIARRSGNRWALWLSSALFAAAHISLMHAPAIFLWGLMMGSLYLLARSIWPCILVHAGHNIFYSTVRSRTWQLPDFLDPQSWNADSVIGVAGVLNIAIFLVILYTLRRQQRI